ncbi:hypothetical protein QOT17_016361 [Balamuthia mandrillaris]
MTDETPPVGTAVVANEVEEAVRSIRRCLLGEGKENGFRQLQLLKQGTSLDYLLAAVKSTTLAAPFAFLRWPSPEGSDAEELFILLHISHDQVEQKHVDKEGSYPSDISVLQAAKTCCQVCEGSKLAYGGRVLTFALSFPPAFRSFPVSFTLRTQLDSSATRAVQTRDPARSSSSTLCVSFSTFTSS